jgi:hypothetical protein
MANKEIKFDLRLKTTNGKDVMKEFKGTLFPDGKLAVAEVKQVRYVAIN